MKIQLTRELVYSAGLDEANRAMRAAGRKSWSEEDCQLAWDTFNRVWPRCVHMVAHGECNLCLEAVNADSLRE